MEGWQKSGVGLGRLLPVVEGELKLAGPCWRRMHGKRFVMVLLFVSSPWVEAKVVVW